MIKIIMILSMVFSIIFLINYYPIKRFSTIFKIIKKPLRFTLIFILLIFLSLFIHRKLNLTITYYIKQTTFQLLGVSFVMLSVTFMLDIFKVIFKPKINLFKKIYLFFSFISISIAIYFGNTIFINNIDIKTDKIKKNVKIAHLTDVHIGSRSKIYLNKIIKLVKENKPDLIVITGDLIDDEHVNIDFLKSFDDINIPILFSYGNHETYFGKLNAEKIIKKKNIIILEQNKKSINGIDIIGISDNYDDVNNLLKNVEIDNNRFNLLMNHQTVSWKGIKENKIDLTLSGHTHGGQIFPFNLLVRLRYPMITGLYQNENSKLYVSPGAGTWGPSMRFGTISEITFINLIKK